MNTSLLRISAYTVDSSGAMIVASPEWGGLAAVEPGGLKDTWLPSSPHQRCQTPEKAGSAMGILTPDPCLLLTTSENDDLIAFLTMGKHPKLLIARQCSQNVPDACPHHR